MARVKEEEEPRVPAVDDLETQAKQYIFFKKQVEYFESEINYLYNGQKKSDFCIFSVKNTKCHF